ncbi:MAG: hypothetical protein JW838_09915 [Spirochaetes bacterium]|nr:hypothetical protein [Spirochaetota bacterium]
MDLKKKIISIIILCIFLSAGTILIIHGVFQRTEDQLLQKCRIEALVGAKVMHTFMELMIHTNLLTPDHLLKEEYFAIKGSNPKKFNTRYDALFDNYIQGFEDEFLKDEDVIFALLIDRNGYVPTHNSKFSLPPDPDPVKNRKFNRSKRNFADKREIMEVLKYTGPGTVRYLYHRDTGELMWNIGSPVHLRDRHWGAFLVGISLHRINIIKNQMIIITVTLMIIILSFTLLVILAVIPQKYLEPPADSGAPAMPKAE